MTTVISVPKHEYDEFFGKAIDALDEHGTKIESIAVVALTNDRDDPYVVSSFGMNEQDMMIASTVLQRLAFSDILRSELDMECEEYEDYEDVDDLDDLDDEGDLNVKK